MTVQTDLQTNLDAYIQANFSGSLAEVSASKKPLEDLLDIQQSLSSGGGSGSSPAFTNSPINLGSANAATLKASAGAVYKVYCYNKNAATRFFQIHNKATTPVNTEVPVESFPVAANSALIIDSTFWGASGRTCSTGVSWAFSTTEATLTLGTAADVTSSVGYL
jgi:hypothetical protein